MYNNGSRTISLEEAQASAEFAGMELQDWATQFGWSEEGKTTVPEETTPPTEPEKTETSAGESSSDDSLLELPGPKPERETTGLPGVDLALADEEKFDPTSVVDQYNKTIGEITAQDAKLEIAELGLGFTRFNGMYVSSSYAEYVKEQRTFIPGTNRESQEFPVPTLGDLKMFSESTPEKKVQYDQMIAFLENIGRDTSDMSQSLEFTAEEMRKGYDLQWADQAYIDQGIFTKKSKESDLFLSDLRKEDREIASKELLKRGSRDVQFNVAMTQNMDPQQAVEKNMQAVSVAAKENYQASVKLNEEIKEWQPRQEAIYKKISNLEQQISQMNRMEPVAPLAPKFAVQPSQEFIDNYNKDIEAYNAYFEKRDALVSEYEAIFESEEYKYVANTQERIVALVEQISNEDKRISTRISDLQDTQIMIESLGKNYSKLSQLALGLEDAFVGSTAAVGEVVAGAITDQFDNGISTGAIFDALESTGVFLADYRHQLSDRKGKLPYERDYDEAEAADATGEWVLNSLKNATPTLAAIFVPSARASRLTRSTIKKSGKILNQSEKAVIAKKFRKTAQLQTMVTFGVMEGGGFAAQTKSSQEAAALRNKQIPAEIAELKKQLTDEKKAAFAAKRIEELENELKANLDLLDLSNLQLASISTMHAITAAQMEKFGTLRSIDKFANGVRAVGYKTFRKVMSIPVARFASGFVGRLKQFGTNIVIEEVEEGGTQLVNNIIDSEIGGLDVHVTDGLDMEFFRQTALTSFVINAKAAGPGLANSVKQVFTTRAENKFVLEKVRSVYDINEKIKNIIESGKGPESMRELRALERERDVLLKEILRNDVTVFSKLNNLEDQDLEQIALADLEIARLQKRAADLGLNAVRDDVNQEELELIFNQIEEYVNIREGLLGKSDEQIKQAAKEAKNGAEAEMQLKELEYSRALAAANKDYLEITSEEDINEENFTPEQVEDLKKRLKRGDNAAYLADGKTVLFLENVRRAILTQGGMAGKLAAKSPMHEFGHKLLRSLGIIKGNDLVGLGDNLVDGILDYLETQNANGTIKDALYQSIVKRINAYKELNKNQHDADELIQMILDLTGAGVLRRSAYGQVWQIKSFINKAIETAGKKISKESSIGPFFKIDSAQDALDFVSYGISMFEQGKQVAQLPPEEEGQTQASLSLLEEVNSLVPESVQTQADFFDRKVFNPIYNDGKLHPAIANYIRSRSVSKEEGDRIIESVADRLINFNPEATRKSGDAKITFGEFLFANVNFGKLDARKALFEEGQERAKLESTDSEQAKQIATASEQTTTQQEKPEYKTLVQRKVLSEEGFDAIAKILQRTVRTLKTRIDKAVSKNVTVKPYIAEIRKNVGKQADIVFKKEMGGLKDGELRKYLLRNKRAILENMTTTYLMTAMPNAVQKKVDGVWTSDWKGKKIDRETTSTDNAGRTSGAEMVRRLPNASTRLSDADFLSNFFTEDGKLIRGRKESLAKAMAEETAFDILNEELENPDSDIRQALEQRQEELSAVLLDNFVANVRRDVERGNAKASLGFDITDDGDVKRFKALVKAVDKNGIDSVVDEKGNLLPGYKEEYGDLDGVGELVREAYDAGAIIDPDGLAYQQRVKRSDLIPDSVKRNTARAINRKQPKERLERFAKERLVIAKALGGNILSVLDASKGKNGNVTILGSHYRVLDPAKVKKDGTKGAYHDNHLEMLASPDMPIPPGLVLEDVILFNSSFGLMAEIHRILDSDISKQEKLQKLEKYRDRIRLANEANIKMYKHIALTLRALYKEGKISGETLVEFFQMQTNLAGGLRALSSFSYFTVTDGPLGKGKGEHLGDNATTGFKIMERMFDDSMTDAEFEARMNLDLRGHDQWLANAVVTKAIDAYGVNNPSLDMRIKFSGKRANDVFTYDGKPATDLIDARMESLKQYEALIDSIDFTELEGAQQAIEEIENSPVGKASLGLSEEFNNIIERKTGVASYKEFSRIQAQLRGRKRGRFKFFIAPGADDFRGLVHYAFAGKGKQGEKDMAFFEEKLMTPYFKGVAAIDAMRQQIKRDFKAVKKRFRSEYKMLSETIGDSGFTYDHALRVYMWNRQGVEVEGLSKRDKKLLLDAIAQNPELVSLADALLVVARRNEWPDPVAYWEGGTVLADLNSMTEKIGRKKFLEEFIANADIIFSEANLNKIEALYGRKHREAIEDSLWAMKNGTNKPGRGDRQVNAWLNWINGSTGAIMFFNRRSALLQMLSFTNFINWSDNNPAKAAAAFANQKQYWKDFAMIFNSDKLKERRGGLKQDVSDSELAGIARESKGSPQAILARLLKLGFTPTQIADSMAIATGGAMFYRNRVNTYLKQGLSQKEAEERAFLDFSKKSDEAQQSSDPALVSQEQRSVLGRLVLAFANTPMQYTRLMKKAALDLINGRGNPVEHISKIAYYGAVQNFIFSALQSAMFSLAFDDDDDDEELTEAEIEKREKKEEQKVIRVVNSMLDTILRGSGVYGAVAATIKNTIMEYYKQEDKGFLADHTYTLLAAASISPPIQSKMRKIYSAIQTKKFEKDNIEARGWALTENGKLNLGPNYSILGNVLSGITNVPMDRVVDELKSISEALDKRNKAWQRIALALGWKTWDVGVRNEEADLIKTTAKEKRKQEGIEKAKVTRAETSAKKKASKREAWAKYVKDNNLSDLDAAGKYRAWEREYDKK